MADPRIERMYREDGGVWIDLAPGYILKGEWTHGIVEDTRRRALSKLAEVIPCECDECSALLRQRGPGS